VNGTDFADVVSRKTKKCNKNIQSDLDVDDAIIASSQPTPSKCVSSPHRSHSADENNIDRLCGEASLLVDSLQCDNCSESYHLTCCQVPDANQARTMALVRFLGWVCRACRFTDRSNLNKLKQTVTDLTREVKSLRSSILLAVTGRSTLANPVDGTVTDVTRSTATTEFSHRRSSATPNVQSTDRGAKQTLATTVSPTQPSTAFTLNDAVKLVNKSIADNNRRKLNVIVKGLPEPTSSSITNSMLFTDLCSFDLHFDLRN